MTQACAAVGLEFERVAAVDGQEPVVSAAAERLPRNHFGLQLAAGAFGCLQSHREVWQRIVAAGDAPGMVLEDDVVLAPGTGACLQESWLPDDADIVRLETFTYAVHLAKEALPAPGGRLLHRLCSSDVGSGCYVVSSKAARRLLEITKTDGDPVDEVLFNERLPFFASAVIYQMYPAPAIQGNRLAAQQSWSRTDIKLIAAEGKVAGKSGETLLKRIDRRLSNEIRGRLRGTRYVAVPHG